MTKQDYREKIGSLIAEIRGNYGYTQADLAKKLGTSQSAINRIERGAQNISLEMIAKISGVLNSEILSVNDQKKLNLRVHGGFQLRGKIETKTSKNAAVALLCASLLNKGKTTLKNVAKIEEVNRILEVLNSIGVKTRWFGDQMNDLEISAPKRLDFENMDISAAKRTRSIIMFLGPLLHQYREFKIPFTGGCNLGARTVEPHLVGLKMFGMSVDVLPHTDYYSVNTELKTPDEPILLTERGDTTTENILMAAANCEKETVIRNASPNYMVQDLCFFLQKLGVEIDGIGPTTLRVRGLKDISRNVD